MDTVLFLVAIVHFYSYTQRLLHTGKMTFVVFSHVSRSQRSSEQDDVFDLVASYLYGVNLKQYLIH